MPLLLSILQDMLTEISSSFSSATIQAVVLGCIATYASYEILGRLISRILWNKHSILKDIPLLSKARPKNQRIPGTAIVCGGSVAGLFAARVCANHFNKVIIIEPEQWVTDRKSGTEDHHRERRDGDTSVHRRGRVAQYTAYHHFHLMMTPAMEEMFSNFGETIKNLGGKFTFRSAVLCMSGKPTLQPTGFPSLPNSVLRYKTYPRAFSITRPLFETTLRRLVLENFPEVEYLHGTATGLVYDDSSNKVTGVNVKLPSGETIEVKGSLVVDATGPALSGFRWLKTLPRFPSLRHYSLSPSLDDIKIGFDPKMSYTTCGLALPPELDEKLRKYGFPGAETGDDESLVFVSLPRNDLNNTHLIFEKGEKNFFYIVCGGYDWRGRVQSIEELREFVENVNTKLKYPLPEWLLQMLQTFQSEKVPASFVHSRCPPSVYIKYHEASHYLPSNLVVVGDALSQTDPINGQGCSKACANAIVLNSQLHRSVSDANLTLSDKFSHNYFWEVKDRTEHIWSNIKNTDYGFSTTVPLPGESLEKTSRFFRTYSEIFSYLATKDQDMGGAFYHQTAWLDPPTAVLAPWIIRRIAWTWMKKVLFGHEIL